MGIAYGEVAQSDNDEDRNGGPSPSLSLSPAPSSSSPMAFRTTRSTFTPLSMDSESYPGLGEQENDVLVNPRENIAGTATAKARLSIGNMVQSLSPARATNLIKRNNQNEYDLLSPGDDPSSTSSSPNFDRTGPRLNQAQAQAQSLNSDSAAHRNLASNPADHESPKPTASHPQRSGDPSANEHPHHPVVQQPIVVKPKPIVRTASTSSVSLRHPVPDLPTRSSSRASNIAQLEATAEQLSLTSSIEDAIRDLHDEQKRNDSRRSSILAAAIGPIPETGEPVTFPITRQISATSSILDTNNAARHGGYSPAGYVMSPNHSLHSTPSRLRSSSAGLSKAEFEIDNFVSRHGPGKSSVRSVRSASKPTLMNIDEMEPTTLTPAAMDEADKLAEKPEEHELLPIPQLEDVDLTPNADQHHRMANAHDYWSHAVADAHQGDHCHDNRPPTPAGSDGTFEQAERAFADFDGAHCSPDVDFEDSLNFSTLFASPTTEGPFWPSFSQDPPNEDKARDPSRPIISRPIGMPTVRPTSYTDPETGKSMLFYPARVPMMLNLPQKLSKKPKAEVRNNRRSQVLNTLPEANRPSRASWLPEFVPEPLVDPLGPMAEGSTTAPAGPSTETQSPVPMDEQNESTPPNEEAHKSRMSTFDTDKRKSRLSALDGLPPQLRASAFFDLPSESPAIQLKDGSAMATLDSILDASAKAPVSAFTDHSFAGTLGSEIYGTDKKRKSHFKRASASNLVEPKKRSSFLHLRKHSALSRHSNPQDERRDTITGASSERGDATGEEGQRLSGDMDGEQVPEDEAQSEGEPVYNGPPTTLLAELQIRKRQQKLRTRPITSAYPNGMHSTLLEMDTVAEIERKARKGKRINLAWEGPGANLGDESDDEDTPLGLLLATKGQANGVGASLADINRPPGLMERRDMEDNEPLSVRRNRLQGRETGPIKRMTMGQGLHISGGMGPQVRVQVPEDDDVEGETLGERMRRLRAQEDGDNPLPRARPVSSSFSTEMLNQLGDAFKDETADTKEKEKAKSQTGDEETLGQRRRRLQAERESQEREMTSMLLTGGHPSDAPKLNKRHSLADILGARGSRTVSSDPRAEAKRAKEEEAARYRRDQEQKMAVLRSQIPATLSSPNLTKSGGYLAGRFNDGTGGGVGQPRTSMATGGFPGDQGMSSPARNSMMGNAFASGGAMSGYGMAAGHGAPVGNAYATPIQVQPAGQMDRVERWRQSIFP